MSLTLSLLWDILILSNCFKLFNDSQSCFTDSEEKGKPSIFKSFKVVT